MIASAPVRKRIILAGGTGTHLIGRDFLGGGPSALILGDNIFYGHEFEARLRAASEHASSATVFAYHVRNPQR